jgi:hypothetical protein
MRTHFTYNFCLFRVTDAPPNRVFECIRSTDAPSKLNVLESYQGSDNTRCIAETNQQKILLRISRSGQTSYMRQVVFDSHALLFEFRRRLL